MIPVEELQGTPYFRNTVPRVTIENFITVNQIEICQKDILPNSKNECLKPPQFNSQLKNITILNPISKFIERNLYAETPGTQVSASQTIRSDADQSLFQSESLNNRIVKKQNTLQISTTSNKIFEGEQEKNISAEKPSNESKIKEEIKNLKTSLFRQNVASENVETETKELKYVNFKDNQNSEIQVIKKLDLSKVDQIRIPNANKKLRESKSLSPPNSTPISGIQNKLPKAKINIEEFSPNSKIKINNPYVSKPFKNKLGYNEESKNKEIAKDKNQIQGVFFPKCQISSINIKKDGDSIIESFIDSGIFERKKDDSCLSPDLSADQTPYGFAKFAKKVENDFESKANDKFLFEEGSEESFANSIIVDKSPDIQIFNENMKIETPINQETFTCMGEI